VSIFVYFLNVFADALNHVFSLRESSSFPKTEDLHGAAIALVRLQDTYLLNVTELADGHFQGVDHSKEKGKLPYYYYCIHMRRLCCAHLILASPSFFGVRIDVGRKKRRA